MVFAWTIALGLGAQDIVLLERARDSFEQVARMPRPDLKQTLACTQEQAAIMPIAGAEQYLAHFRKGYCTLMHAALIESRDEFLEAARELEAALNDWPRTTNPKKPAPALSAAVPALLGIARAKAGQAAAELRGDVQLGSCGAGPIAPELCESALRIAKLWRDRDLPGTGWNDWNAARKAFARREWRTAIDSAGRALDLWASKRELLGPRPETEQASMHIAMAHYQLREFADAIAAFDAVIRIAPANARAIFLRGRAKDMMGRSKPAEEDYQLASRTAYAGSDTAMATGQGHYYRGVLLFRRKNYEQAEREFASALSATGSELPDEDVRAWWHMSAVASGLCGSSAELLARAAIAASAFFPKEEADAMLRDCRRKSATAHSLCYSS